jgi:hypothetical protein
VPLRLGDIRFKVRGLKPGAFQALWVTTEFSPTLRPETKTLQNRNVVMPPMTQSGMEEMIPETAA